MGRVINIYCDVCQDWFPSTGWDAWDKGNGKHEITCCMCCECSKIINDSDYYGVDFWSSSGRITIEEPQQEIIEPTPEPTPIIDEPVIDEPVIDEPVKDNPSVSYNDLLIEIRRLREDVQNITNGTIPVRVLNYDDFNNQTEYIVSSNAVSQNIMTTPINEYTLPESLQLITLLALILGGLIYIVRRCIYKWS